MIARPHPHPAFHLLGFALLACLPAALVWSQDPAAAPQGDAKAPAAPKKSTRPDRNAAPLLSPEFDPLSVVLQGLDYTKPADVMFALETNLKLARYNDAKALVKRLQALKLPPAALAQLVREHGSGVFIRLIRTVDLQPEGGQIGAAALAAADAHAHDPARLQGLIDKLKEPRADLRAVTITDLQSGGATAVELIIKNLSAAKDETFIQHLQTALVALGRPAIEPLIGAARSGPPEAQARSIPVLAALRADHALPHLIRPALSKDAPQNVQAAAQSALRELTGIVPTLYDGREFLKKTITSYSAGTAPSRPDSENLVSVWRWDSAAQTVVVRKWSVGDSSLIVAEELARDLLAIGSESGDVRQFALLAVLEGAKTRQGLTQPLTGGPGSAVEIASAAGVDACEAALYTSLKSHRVLAAIAAAEVLGQIGGPNLLDSRDGQPRVLVQALRYPDRRLQFAAAAAIVRLDPQRSFAGAGYWSNTVGLLAGCTGKRRVIVGDQRTQQVQAVVAMLNELGFEATSASSGRDLVRQAAQTNDCEFVIVSDVLDSPNDSETLQQLRIDPRTAFLPVGLMTRDNTLDRAEQLAAVDRYAVAFPRPLQNKTLQQEVARILGLAGPRHVSRDERVAQAREALGWAARLASASGQHSGYDLLAQEEQIEKALYVPELSVSAAQALAQIGSHSAQSSLVNLAGLSAYDPSVRAAAVGALATAVQKRGLLLTTDEISQQYDRYNRSRSQPKDLQQSLGALLDVIEWKYKQEHPERK